MFNRICIYCECPYSYYSDNKHASRKSCKVSLSGFHNFQIKIMYYVNKFLAFLKLKFNSN